VKFRLRCDFVCNGRDFAADLLVGAKPTMKKPRKQSRPRSIRRRPRGTHANKTARKKTRPAFASLITPGPGAAGHAGYFDDCPICRAMAATGATPDRDGLVEMSADQHALYRARLQEIVAEEGWPDGAQWVSGEQLRRSFDEVQRTLEARGHRTDIDEMDEDELGLHLERVMQVLAEREDDDIAWPVTASPMVH
jgi:hypothetical protein